MERLSRQIRHVQKQQYTLGSPSQINQRPSFALHVRQTKERHSQNRIRATQRRSQIQQPNKVFKESLRPR